MKKAPGSRGYSLIEMIMALGLSVIMIGVFAEYIRNISKMGARLERKTKKSAAIGELERFMARATSSVSPALFDPSRTLVKSGAGFAYAGQWTFPDRIVQPAQIPRVTSGEFSRALSSHELEMYRLRVSATETTKQTTGVLISRCLDALKPVPPAAIDELADLDSLRRPVFIGGVLRCCLPGANHTVDLNRCENGANWWPTTFLFQDGRVEIFPKESDLPEIPGMAFMMVFDSASPVIYEMHVYQLINACRTSLVSNADCARPAYGGGADPRIARDLKVNVSVVRNSVVSQISGSSFIRLGSGLVRDE